jgi:hypothetical protein
MTARPHGLIIAIEQYDPQALPAKLEGTVGAARKFRKWLETSKSVKSADIIECVSGTWPAPATTRDAIAATLRKIMVEWQGEVSELYVYLSGHGLSQRLFPWLASDYLLTSDFRSFDVSGASCVPLHEMREKLAMSLGPGDHYYFVDVCRTDAATQDIEMANMGVKPNRAANGSSAYCVLFSVRPGAKAAVDSGFGAAVLAGLSGKGRAKTWVEDGTLAVTFERLLQYVQAKVKPQEVDQQQKGMSKGVILPIQPVVSSPCTIEVIGATDADAFQLSVANTRKGWIKTFPFTGNRYDLTLDPDDYAVVLTQGSEVLTRIAPPPGPVDLFDAGTVLFRKFSAPSAAASAGEVMVGAGMEEPAAEYARDPVSVSRTSEQTTPAHDSIRIALNQPSRSLVDFSESMRGPIANQDLSLWLAILGASRIVDDPGAFQKLREMQLARFEDVPKNGSALYVLVGFERRASQVEIDVDGSDAVRAAAAPRLDNVLHRRIDAERGPHLVTLAFGEPHNARLTIATHCLPNRVTVLIVVRAVDGRWIVRQLMPPLYTHLQYLDPMVLTSMNYLESRGFSPLRLVELSMLAQTEFTRKRDIRVVVTKHDELLWNILFYGKWLDPLMSLLAAYDVLRRSTAPDDFATIVHNLRTYFPNIPDTEVVAKMAGLPSSIPQGTPLFLDGALAMPDFAPEELSGTRQVLDYRTPWTMWTGKAHAIAKAVAASATVS